MKDILLKAKLTEGERLALAALCDGPCSAETLASRLDLKHFVQANKLVGDAGRKIFDAAPENSPVRRWHPKGRPDHWFLVVAPCRRSEVDGKAYWEIRPEVRRAFIEIGWYAATPKASDQTHDYEPRLEGGEAMQLLSARERDPVLRAACIAAQGCRCVVCGDDLGELYGEMGKGFIHVHHLNPLAARKGRSLTDPVKDLIPVCPNCHAIIHRGGGAKSPDEVRRGLRQRNRPIEAPSTS